MKIGLFIPNATFDLPGSAEVGGIEVYAFELGEALQKRGHDVILFGGEPKAGRAHRPTSLKLSLHPYIETRDIPKLGTRFRKLVQRFKFASASRKAVLEARRDAMIVFKPYDFINAWRWKRKQPSLKVVMNYQGKDFFQTDRFWRRFVDWEYAASDENAQLAAQRYGATPEVFPNGVDTELFKPAAEQPDTPPLVIMTAGRMVGWKGLEFLLRAAADLPGVEIRMAGDGPEKARLFSLATELRMAGRVHFPGVLGQRELAQELCRAHVFAQPSIDFDACPTAVLQALSCGLVVAMSDQVGLRQYFPASTASITAPARDVAGWRKLLHELTLLSPVRRNAIGLRAREIVEAQFSWPTVAGKIEERLLRLLGSEGRIQ